MALAQLYTNAAHEPLRPAVKSSYMSFKDGLAQQFSILLQLGIRVTFTEEDPYRNSADMFMDLEARNLSVFAGGQLPADHPLATASPFGASWNCVFRAVHDYFGHFGGSSLNHYPFGTVALIEGGDGLWNEEAAFQRHSLMLPREAQLALVCETRAQTACNNLLRPKGGYTEQKACFMPPWTYMGSK